MIGDNDNHSALPSLRAVRDCALFFFAGSLSQGDPHDLEGFLRVLSVNTVGTFNVLRLAAMK